MFHWCIWVFHYKSVLPLPPLQDVNPVLLECEKYVLLCSDVAERNKRWLWWYILSIALITSHFFPTHPVAADTSVSATAVRRHCDYYCSLSVFYALGSNPEKHSVSGDLRGQIAQRKMITWTTTLFFTRTFLQVSLRHHARNSLPCHT